jgi:RND family efflux transporter MFP subunit
MTNWRSWKGRLLAGGLLLAAAGMVWLLAGAVLHGHHKEPWPADAPRSERDPDAVMVTSEPATCRPVQRLVQAVGTLHGFEEVSIAARVEGRVRKLHRDVADRVQPGELLLEIDPTDHALAVQHAERGLQIELARLGLTEPPSGEVDLAKVPSVMQARARLANAKGRHERASRLVASRSISSEEADSCASEYHAAQAEYANQLLLARSGLATIQMRQVALAVARQQWSDTQVRAPTPSLPVPGSSSLTYAITQRPVAEGTLVQPGSEVFRLVINQVLKLRVTVPERHSATVGVGQAVDVFTAAFVRPFSGTVNRVNPAVDPATRTFEVEVIVPNPDGDLKPGGFARAAIHTRVDCAAVTVPLSAVVQFAGITKVFVVEDGKAKEVPVTLGVQTTDWVEIVNSELRAGTHVVTSGQNVLAADTRVSIRDAVRSKMLAGNDRPKGDVEESSAPCQVQVGQD